MILIIWMIWLFNQFFILVTLLNFLIAIIQQSFEQVMTQELQNKYAQRCSLNKDCLEVFHYLGYLPKQTICILYLSFEENYEDDVDEWKGFVRTLKNVTQEQHMNTIANLETKLDAMSSKHQQDVD